MSANNWSDCPNCLAKEKARQKAAREQADAEYGKVNQRDYALLMKEAHPRKVEASLREDWELGVDESGEFSVNYGCMCQTCGFSFTYRHKQQVPVKGGVV